MTFKVTQDYRQVTYHLLLVLYSNNVSLLHGVRDITTFTVYVTVCDLEKSFSFNKTVEITGHFPSSIHVWFVVIYRAR